MLAHNPDYEKEDESGDRLFLFNFCTPFNPPEQYNCSAAYSFVLEPSTNSCQSYSSDSKLSMYESQALYDS